MRTETQRPRRKWPWAVGGAIVVAALIVAVTAWYGNQSHGPDGKPETTTTAPAHPTGDASGVPTGCLGGQGRDAAMVLAARKDASHTTSGAVEFAAAFTRWLYRYPGPTPDEFKSAAAAISPEATSFDWAAYLATKPNLSAGLVPDGQEFYLSTVPGVYNVEDAAADRVSVAIGTAPVIGGALSPTLRNSITITVEWQPGGWQFVKSAGTRTTQDLFKIGKQFAGGC